MHLSLIHIYFARERMLNADVTTMSVGHYEGGVYNNYWVLIFSCLLYTSRCV